MNLFSLFSEQRSKIVERNAQVATVGLGYVGLPLALTVHEAGFPVVGFDLRQDHVDRINAGERVISYFTEDRVAQAVASKRFSATADPSRLAQADVILVCVPTPLSPSREPDLSYVARAGEEIARHLRPGQLVILESTVWPGATRTFLQPILEKSGLRAGREFFLGFSPEREDPGNESHSTKTIPKIVGADDTHSFQLMQAFYGAVIDNVVPVSSTATAEAVKLVENTFRNVNIALVNEFKPALAAMGVDVWEAVEAAATKPFGFMPFYPGPGVGGDCIPVSPVYLSWRARDVGSSLPIVDLARHANANAPLNLADQLADLLSGRGTPLDRARILLLGVTYKRNVEDTRVSPALDLMLRLEELGAGAVDYHDAYFPTMPMTRDYPSLAGRRSVPVDPATVAGYDVVVVTTNHDGVDYDGIARAARLVVDTRNVYRADTVGATVVKL